MHDDDDDDACEVVIVRLKLNTYADYIVYSNIRCVYVLNKTGTRGMRDTLRRRGSLHT